MAVGDPEAFRPWSMVFPETITTGNLSRTRGGMTLRDWFAGQALAGICANYGERCFKGENDGQGWAEEAYHLADAMIAQRDNGTGIRPQEDKS